MGFMRASGNNDMMTMITIHVHVLAAVIMPARTRWGRIRIARLSSLSPIHSAHHRLHGEKAARGDLVVCNGR